MEKLKKNGENSSVAGNMDIFFNVVKWYTIRYLRSQSLNLSANQAILMNDDFRFENGPFGSSPPGPPIRFILSNSAGSAVVDKHAIILH